jgi:hypothetical protein
MHALIAAAAFAVAAPGADLGPVLTGDGVAWTTRGGQVVRSAGGAPETLATARRWELTWLAGSGGRLVAIRDPRRGVQTCFVSGPCTPPRGEVLTGVPTCCVRRSGAGAAGRCSRSRASSGWAATG